MSIPPEAEPRTRSIMEVLGGTLGVVAGGAAIYFELSWLVSYVPFTAGLLVLSLVALRSVRKRRSASKPLGLK